MISQSELLKLFRMISRCVIMCDECALRFYVCSIFVDRVFVLFIFHHGVQRTYKCFAYVAPRGWIWVRRGLCGFGDIRGSVGRYHPWGIKATGFAVTTKINHYAAVTRDPPANGWPPGPGLPCRPPPRPSGGVARGPEPPPQPPPSHTGPRAGGGGGPPNPPPRTPPGRGATGAALRPPGAEQTPPPPPRRDGNAVGGAAA